MKWPLYPFLGKEQKKEPGGWIKRKWPGCVCVWRVVGGDAACGFLIFCKCLNGQRATVLPGWSHCQHSSSEDCRRRHQTKSYLITQTNLIFSVNKTHLVKGWRLWCEGLSSPSFWCSTSAAWVRITWSLLSVFKLFPWLHDIHTPQINWSVFQRKVRIVNLIGNLTIVS